MASLRRLEDGNEIEPVEPPPHEEAGHERCRNHDEQGPRDVAGDTTNESDTPRW